MSHVVLAIVKFLMNIIVGVFQPLDNFIVNNIPSLNTPLGYINNLLTWLTDFVLWVLSWLPFDTAFWTFFIAFIILIITISIGISLIKLVVHWWHYLAP